MKWHWYSNYIKNINVHKLEQFKKCYLNTSVELLLIHLNLIKMFNMLYLNLKISIIGLHCISLLKKLHLRIWRGMLS